jgi:hypothetical protein
MKAPFRQKSCLFCGCTLYSKKTKTGGKSNEHIIPKWLMEYLGVPNMTITPTVTEVASGRIVDLRKHAVSAFVAGTVCGTCNNGWMSRLEGDTKPVLIPLIEDPRRLENLDQKRRALIARWALKTAAMLNRASAYSAPGNSMSRPVPDDHLRKIMNGGCPSGVVVVGCGYASSKPLDWLQFGTWITPANSVSLLEEDRNRSYKIALAFRDLVLAVVYYPSADYHYAVIEGHYVPLWVGDRGFIPIPRQLDDSPAVSNSPILEGLLRNIFVLSKTWVDVVGNVSTTRFILEP